MLRPSSDGYSGGKIGPVVGRSGPSSAEKGEKGKR